jgi:hypothetical protein
MGMEFAAIMGKKNNNNKGELSNIFKGLQSMIKTKLLL